MKFDEYIYAVINFFKWSCTSRYHYINFTAINHGIFLGIKIRKHTDMSIYRGKRENSDSADFSVAISIVSAT